LGSVTFLFSVNRSVCAIMWTNGVERGSPQMTIWRMRIACRVPDATNTHSEHVILIAFPRQPWLRETVLVLRLYVRCLSCKLDVNRRVLF
jgi:hypothetical protein